MMENVTQELEFYLDIDQLADMVLLLQYTEIQYVVYIISLVNCDCI